MRRALIGKGDRVKDQAGPEDRVITPQATTPLVRRRSVISISRRYLG
ncbi:hypothetical protein [Providencia sp. PROV255]|nr:hypothetical protein [Providencia sp. PROV255]